ncbi:MAG: alpha/beta fold hydrolase [Candidatus Hydrogenedens sp.]|nr:alpha/beta fold hydrolase [Candidatus Hydrogenedens sp.]
MKLNKPRTIGLTIAVLLGIVITWPFVMAKTERIPLDDAARAAMKDAGETFVQLSDGWTHYRWNGPAEGPIVVFVHGFSSPMFIWENQAQALGAAGFRVLRYDLFGRGHSDRPEVNYDGDLYDRQLTELLDALKVEGPVDVVGLSMGGPITVRFVDRHPERVRRYGLIAPAGFGANVPAVAQLLRVPGFNTWMMRALGDAIVLGSIEKMASNDPQITAEFRRQYMDQLQYEGYKRALLSTLLHHPMLGLGDMYERVGKQGKPCILFWGDADKIVPFANSDQVRSAMPQIEFHRVPEGSHTANFERPELVNPPLIAFLKQP